MQAWSAQGPDCMLLFLKLQELVFLSKSGNTIHESIEDDIRADLASLGISTVPVALAQDKYNQRNAVSVGIIQVANDAQMVATEIGCWS